MLSRFAEDFLFIWIPACAGMTQFCAIDPARLCLKSVRIELVEM